MIALVGAASHKRLAPFGVPGWELWACSMRNEDELPGVDVWFELHDPARFPSVAPTYIDFLARQKRVWMMAPHPDIPGSVAYPKAEMLSAFGPYFFTSTVAWMMALAICQRPQRIGIWGVNMTNAHGVEFAHQRPGVQHFIQVAHDRDIEVVVPEGCNLLSPPPLYRDWDAQVQAA